MASSDGGTRPATEQDRADALLRLWFHLEGYVFHVVGFSSRTGRLGLSLAFDDEEQAFRAAIHEPKIGTVILTSVVCGGPIKQQDLTEDDLDLERSARRQACGIRDE